MKLNLKREAVAGSVVCLLAMAGMASASNVNVGVDVVTPNVRVSAGTAAPPPVVVVERERVVVREKGGHQDNGKHKGHDKKHHKKKHKHHDD